MAALSLRLMAFRLVKTRLMVARRILLAQLYLMYMILVVKVKAKSSLSIFTLIKLKNWLQSVKTKKLSKKKINLRKLKSLAKQMSKHTSLQLKISILKTKIPIDYKSNQPKLICKVILKSYSTRKSL